jgi:hypothetical protein
MPIAIVTMINNPIGIFDTTPGVMDWKVGIASGGGGVKVGKRVGAEVTMNCAARVGSIVGVYSGVGVGGGSTTGNCPGDTSTNGE